MTMKPKSEIERISEKLNTNTSPDHIPLDTRFMYNPKWREGGSSSMLAVDKRASLAPHGHSTLSPSRSPTGGMAPSKTYEPYAEGYEQTSDTSRKRNKLKEILKSEFTPVGQRDPWQHRMQ